MSVSISSINYCPVKSISFQTVSDCKIRKNIGIVGDRVIAFSKGLEFNQVQLFEKNLDERRGKWNKILTLKNSPMLNKYNFKLTYNKLTFIQKNNEILTIDVSKTSEHKLLTNKIYAKVKFDRSSMCKRIGFSLLSLELGAFQPPDQSGQNFLRLRLS